MDHDRYGSAAYGASAGPASGDVYMADATRGADHAGPEADRYRSARHNRPENDDERSQRRSGRREYERDDRRRDYDRERDYSYDREHGYDRERDHDRRRSGRRDEGGYGGSHHHRNSRDDGHYESPARPHRRGYDDHYDDDHRGGASRGGGGGGGRGRGGPDWRNADAREPSPTIKRSPTPEGTIPLSQRQRRNSKWDLAPDGFEGIGALQAKASGIFGRGAAKALSAVPHMGQDGGGHGGLPPIHIGGNGSGMGLPGGQIGAQASLAVNPNVNRQARRLYVGNITYEANEAIIASFFNHRMREIGHAPPGEGDPCVGAQINPDKGYAFVEFRSPEEATIAMGFDGIVFQNQSLKIRRPKDYQGPDIAPPRAVHVPGVISTNVPDSPNKIFIGGLPTYIADEQVIELLKAFGELRAFNLVKEAGSGASKGFAFCEYVDPAITDIACQGLNDIELGGRRLVVQRASVGANRTGPTGSNIGPLGPGGIIPPSFTADGGQAGEPTPCMQMLNMVTPQELIDDEEYTEIVEDVRDECAKFGTVLDVRIPRPMAESKGAAGNTWRVTQTAKTGDNEDSKVEREGVGRVYVKFAAVDECAVALQQIAGRQFGGRVVICAFLREEEWPADEDGGENADATTGQMNDGVGAAAGQAAAAGLADTSAAEEGAPKAENAEPVKAEEDQ